MSGIGFKIRPQSDGDHVCILQGAHPPGKPLQLWYYNGVLSEVQEEENHYALSALRDVLHFIYSEGGDE